MDFIKDSTTYFILQDEELVYWPKCFLKSELCSVMVFTPVLQVKVFQGE